MTIIQNIIYQACHLNGNRHNSFLLSFIYIKIDWNSRGYINFDIWYPNRKSDPNHLLIEHQRKVCELNLIFFNCARWISLVPEINILGGNNKTVVWSAAYPISDLFGKGEPILGKV